MELTIYDKFSWHQDAGINDATLKAYYEGLMDFLKKHQLLNKVGMEIYDLGIDPSLSVTSKMLTDKGNKLLSLWYDKYLTALDFNKEVDLSFFEDKLTEI